MKSRFRLRQTKLIVIGVIGAAIIAGTAIAANIGNAKSEHWGIIDRNTIGSPVGQLRTGHDSNSSTGDISAPPYGKGSLGITVGDGQEKMAFGDETDFVGVPLSAINAVGYSVFRTGEDVGYGGPNNLPNIAFEVDPNITPSVNYSSLVWNPDGSSGSGERVERVHRRDNERLLVLHERLDSDRDRLHAGGQLHELRRRPGRPRERRQHWSDDPVGCDRKGPRLAVPG